MQFTLILLGTILLGALYGALRDGLIRLYVPEYFSLAVDKTVPLESVLLAGAVTWGTFGAVLGTCLACAARLGKRPKRTARDLRKPLLLLLAMISVFSLLAGIFGAVSTSFGLNVLPPEVRERFQMRQWSGLQFGWFAQIMGNYVGFVAGGMMIGWVWVSRKRFTARKPNIKA